MSALILALALLLPASQQERVRVNAQLSQTTARVGETVVLSITIETAGNPDVDIAMPQLPSQLVIAGTQESTHMQYSIPGGRRRVVTRELSGRGTDRPTCARSGCVATAPSIV